MLAVVYECGLGVAGFIGGGETEVPHSNFFIELKSVDGVKMERAGLRPTCECDFESGGGGHGGLDEGVGERRVGCGSGEEHR